jgi:predicted DNA-binding WGR domain protein
VSGVSTSSQAQADNPESADPADFAPGSFEAAARFVSVDPTKHRSRFYELRLQATLWGGVALVRAWDRLGTPGRWRAREYPDWAAAQPDVKRAVRRRPRRGYRLVPGR